MITNVDNHKILRVIQEELEELPTLPVVVTRVMRAANDPATSATTLKNMIMTDQAFAAKILQLVNSPFYGVAGQVTTITHAIVVLGFTTVRDLAVSLGVSKGFGSGRGPSALNLSAFWSHSVATACAASVIARRKGLAAKALEEVFIGGLMHDVGKLFLNRYFAEQYSVTLKYASSVNCSILEAEQRSLGIGHYAVGKRVADKWTLPEATAAMIAYHHHPQLAEAHVTAASVVHAADYLVRKLKIGNAGDDIEPVLDPDVELWLNFLPNVWDNLGQETLQKYASAASLLRAMLGS